MRISRLCIENFRSIRNLDIELGQTTVFIGPNNAGKTAILDAVRIVLTRRWGQRGTGFTEHDVHRPDEGGDSRTLPPVAITLVLEEPQAGAWDADMVASLEDIMAVLPDGRSILSLRVTCSWNAETEAFDPAWQFLDAAGQPMPERRRAINLTGFFGYLPMFWLGALRDAANEFTRTEMSIESYADLVGASSTSIRKDKLAVANQVKKLRAKAKKTAQA